MAAFFSLDSVAPGIGSGNVNDPRNEHGMRQRDVTAGSVASADDTIDLRAIYHDAVLERNLRSFNLLLHQNPRDLAQRTCQSFEVWNILINSYEFENNLFNYRNLFIGPEIKGITQLNLTADSFAELKMFLFAHKANGDKSLANKFEEKWSGISDDLIKKFALAENSVISFYETYHSFLKVTCSLISSTCFLIVGFTPDDQAREWTTDGKCLVNCRSVTPVNKKVLAALGTIFLCPILFSELFINFIKLRYATFNNIYRAEVKKAAEMFALYLVLIGYDRPNLARMLFGLFPENYAMSVGISKWRINGTSIAETAIEGFI